MKLIVNTNSYVTISEADKIVENYFLEDDVERLKYENLSDDDKSAILYRSCLDMQVIPYRGYKKDPQQTLAFPRINRAGYESDEYTVKLAQVLNAFGYINTTNDELTNNVAELKRNGVTQFSLGSFSISINKDINGQPTSKSGIIERYLYAWLMGGVKIKR